MPAMRVFQYWDAPVPPTDVATWIADVREQNPEYEHQLYSRNEAAEYIGCKIGVRERSAFLKCAVPAGQADYFRLCAMVADGGLYLDADSQPLKALSTLIDDVPEALLCTYGGALNNSIMLFRAPAHPFIIDCLMLATDNIENERFDNVMSSVGPSVLSAVYAVIDDNVRGAILQAHNNAVEGVGKDWLATAQSVKDCFPKLLSVADELVRPTPAKLSAFRNITIRHVFQTLPWIGPQQPAYKTTKQHWVHWQGSIYISDRTRPAAGLDQQKL